jgi:hypothetical protein
MAPGLASGVGRFRRTELGRQRMISHRDTSVSCRIAKYAPTLELV